MCLSSHLTHCSRCGVPIRYGPGQRAANNIPIFGRPRFFFLPSDTGQRQESPGSLLNSCHGKYCSQQLFPGKERGSPWATNMSRSQAVVSLYMEMVPFVMHVTFLLLRAAISQAIWWPFVGRWLQHTTEACPSLVAVLVLVGLCFLFLRLPQMIGGCTPPLFSRRRRWGLFSFASPHARTIGPWF